MMWEDNSTKFNLLSTIELLCRRLKNSIKSQTSQGIAPISLVTLLGLAGVSWIGQSAIAPSIAQAYTANVEVALNLQTGESYQTLLNRAEAIARAAAQRSFDRDILATDVAVMVIAENNGSILPILSLQVSRQKWKSRPETKLWATYYPNSEALLLQIGQQTAGQPAPMVAPPVPVPTPNVQQQPQITPAPVPGTNIQPPGATPNAPPTGNQQPNVTPNVPPTPPAGNQQPPGATPNVPPTPPAGNQQPNNVTPNVPQLPPPDTSPNF